MPRSAHAVDRVQPPRWLMRLVNPVTRWMLSSRFHTPISEALVLLHFRGRRTGRLHTVPAGHHEIDGRSHVLTNSGWRHNFEGGRDIEITYRGQRRPAFAVLVSDPNEVASLYHDMITEVGVQQAQRRLGIRVNVDRAPTLDELRDAIVRSGLAVVRLDPPEPATERDG